MRGLVFVFVSLFVTGCATTEYVQPELPLPARPELPRIPKEELQCHVAEALAYIEQLAEDRDAELADAERQRAAELLQAICLSDDAYSDLFNRDRRLRDYAEQLESVIRSTHGGSQ